MDSVRVRAFGEKDALVGVRRHLTALFSDVIANRSDTLALEYRPREVSPTPFEMEALIARREGEANR